MMTHEHGELTVVGKSLPRKDAYEKVTGKALYPTNLELPGMLHAKILRSPYAHAKILSIDTSKAEAYPGVEAVITYKDIPDRRYGYGLNDQPMLARDKVRYIGEPVAAVAAKDVDTAEEALELIDVKYKELPAIFDVEEAFKPDCPVVLHEDYAKYELTFFPPAKMDAKRPNVANHFIIRKGDVEKGFKEADYVLEGKFKTPRQQHVPMEPHAAMARIENDGSVTVWASSQQPSLLTNQISTLLDIPPSKIRVIVPYLGGGFGNKTQLKAEGVCIALAKKTGKPVKCVFTREEVNCGTTSRGGTVSRVKIGVKKDGKIVAMECEILYSSGAYSGDAFVYSTRGPFEAAGTYKIPNLKLDSYLVYVNEPVSGAFRGFGNPELNWGIEIMMSQAADKIGMDRAKFRKINLLREGDESGFGEIMHSLGTEECLEKTMEELAWDKMLKKEEGIWKRGKGIALGNKYSIAPSASYATLKVHVDGTIEVRISAIEIGQGSTTILAQIAAEYFGLPLDKIKMVVSDTAVTPFDFGTVSSRITYHVGNAILKACEGLKKQICELAARKIDVKPEDLDVKGGKIFSKHDPSKKIGIEDLFSPTLGMGHIGKYAEVGGELIQSATFFSKMGKMDPATNQLLNKHEKSCSFWMEIANGAIVDVDTETGEVKVRKFVNACDVGRAINPMLVEGQLDGGGVGMGLGLGLWEEMIFKDGKIMNSNFIDYKLPRARDLPSVKDTVPIIVETPHREGPYGAKGIGEATMICAPAAVADAIHDATGVWITELPMTSEKLYNLLHKKV